MKIRSHITTFTAALAVLLTSVTYAEQGSRTPGSGATGAADPQQPSTTSFETMDTNKDGYISRSESAKSQDLDWKQLDRNNDGRIDQSEFSASPQDRQMKNPSPGTGSTGQTGSQQPSGQGQPR